ncbi:N-acetylmuramoyl-L-alanine amidase [uncultured Bilophila sp.]|uniref:N-acetylmuramoyl-L-alanine amidase n=1 Tax=uncultured Bilophila sp. TaxID=529385 RepID=UPI00280BCB6D|nr:N-acetylmuramoyl-L-alanine amidase [uncultured Bilophila sp.]
MIPPHPPHSPSPAAGRLLRLLLAVFIVALIVAAPSGAHAAPSFEQQYEKAKQDMERLKNDSKRGGWREPWEALAQSFFDLHEKYPRWRNRPAALFRSALAMEELAKRSMLRQDAQTAVDRYGVFLKNYAGHVLADDALFGVARIKAERFNDFSGAQEALNAIQNQYPRGDVAPEAKLYAQRLKAALEAAKNSTPGKKTAALLTDMKWENQKGLAVITLEFDRPIIWSIDTQSGSKKNDTPNRMVVDLMGVNPASTIRPGIKVQGSSLRRMRLDLSAPDKTRLLLDFRQVKRFMVKTESSPFRIVVTTSATDAAMPCGIAFGQGLQSSDPLFRFAARTVVLDPGHGGKDPGTVHNGIVEREVTLDIAKRVGNILAGKGIQVRYTRTDNTWVSLSTRAYMANQARADALLSIHVNASPNESACGLETYFPDTAASNADANKLVGLENANGGHKGDVSPASASSVRSQESRRLADTVQKCALSVMKEKSFTVRDGGVKSGPFRVLLGANIPGVLVEVGYCSNAQEAANLAIPAYRQALAEGIASGILAHLGSLDGGKR